MANKNKENFNADFIGFLKSNLWLPSNQLTIIINLNNPF